MPRVLTVDDSRAIRMIVSKVLVEMGLEVSEGEDGEKGLAVLKNGGIDLVVLDVTMPILDGPGMLARMRQGGDKTPVLVLTTEAKRSIVADLMKLGIEDYILKPFKNEDLRSKIQRILKLKPAEPAATAGAPAGAAAGGSPGSSATAEGGAAGGQRADVLVVDDMDNVPKRLRALIPQQISMMTAANGQAGLKLAREASFRLVLVDRELPDMTGATLVKQLRVLQPNAVCLAMSLRTSATLTRDVKEEGYDDVLVKPFSPDAVEELLQNFLASKEQALLRQEDVISAAAYTGRPEKLDRHYGRLIPSIKDVIREVAEACFDTVFFDAALLPPHPSRLVQLVAELEAQTKKFGLTLRLVVPAAVQRTLREYDETKGVETFDSIAKAREASS